MRKGQIWTDGAREPREIRIESVRKDFIHYKALRPDKTLGSIRRDYFEETYSRKTR